MRTMKEPNYSNLRELIRENSGGRVINIIRENQEHLELDPRVFDLVFENFWDLYTFKPSVPDINTKKLLAWINKIKLIVNDSTRVESNSEPVAPTGDEEEETKAEVATPVETQAPLTAVVRIRIPKKQPEVEKDDEGNEIVQEINEEDLEEMPIEDKCYQVATSIEGQNIYCINQAAGRVYRMELITQLAQNIKQLNDIDLTEF